MSSRLIMEPPPGWDRALVAASLLDHLDPGWWRADADPAVDVTALGTAGPALSLLAQRGLDWAEIQRRARAVRTLPEILALAEGTPEACGLSGDAGMAGAFSLLIRARRMAITIPGNVPWHDGASPWQGPEGVVPMGGRS